MKNIVPEWFKKASVYQINPRTFSKEGTIKAVTDELPFLADLGFKIMYLCPIFEEDDSADTKNWSKRQIASKTQNPKNPYRMNDYFKIDSEYGNTDDLREFVCRSHELGMKVILDLVYFHIGPNAPILQIHPEFARQDEHGNFLMGIWNFPVLNYECEGLREYLFCNMTYYVGEIGVDGFRCDVGDMVPLDFWREGKRRITAINPHSIMINEGGEAKYLEVFDANYGICWHNCIYDLINKNKTIKQVIEEYEKIKNMYPKNALVLRDMDNHDTVTDWPYRIEEHFGSDCMELILATNYVIDGVPMVYCGNELADKAKLSMFANRFHKGEFEVTDRKVKNKFTKRRTEIIKILNNLKSNIEALSSGETKWINNEEDYLIAFERITNSEKIAFVGNYSDDDLEISITQNEILLSNNAEFKDGKLLLSSYGYIVAKV